MEGIPFIERLYLAKCNELTQFELVTHPNFKDYLTFRLDGCARFAAAAQELRGSKLTEQQCTEYINLYSNVIKGLLMRCETSLKNGVKRVHTITQNIKNEHMYVTDVQDAIAKLNKEYNELVEKSFKATSSFYLTESPSFSTIVAYPRYKVKTVDSSNNSGGQVLFDKRGVKYFTRFETIFPAGGGTTKGIEVLMPTVMSMINGSKPLEIKNSGTIGALMLMEYFFPKRSTTRVNTTVIANVIFDTYQMLEDDKIGPTTLVTTLLESILINLVAYYQDNGTKVLEKFLFNRDSALIHNNIFDRVRFLASYGPPMGNFIGNEFRKNKRHKGK